MNADAKVVYEFGPFRMDPDKQVLLRDGELIAVTPKAFETLLVLVRHGREVVSKEELLKEIWPDSFVEEANLSQHIFKLRKALGDTLEGEQLHCHPAWPRLSVRGSRPYHQRGR
jgi:DNA-binding winged helix-turn-helix (wHTH) protein